METDDDEIDETMGPCKDLPGIRDHVVDRVIWGRGERDPSLGVGKKTK